MPTWTEPAALTREGQAAFYCAIGLCVTEYQAVEDALPTVFGSALKGSRVRSDAIFSIANGLQAKIAIVSAAMGDLSGEAADSWKALASRIQQSADFRNKIAHGRSTHFGGHLRFHVEEERVVSMTTVSAPRMQMHKKGKGGANQVIELEEIQAEYQASKDLMRDMIAFIADLAPPPARTR